MISSLNTKISSNSTSSATTEILRAVQSQSYEEKILLTSKEEVEKKLASMLIQVQQNQIKRLDLTSASLGRYYELANTFSGHKEAVRCLAVLKNSMLVSGSDTPENTIKLWDLVSGSCLATLQGHAAAVLALVVLRNGLLASGSDDNTIKLWNLVSGSCLSTREHPGSVEALVAFHNGQIASDSDDNTIKLWDLPSHSCLGTLQGHTCSINALAILPNGQLASGSSDTTVKLWDLSSRTCLSTFRGHTASVWALAVLPNGLLASGSSDTTIKLWDLTSRSCLSILRGHTSIVWALAVLPNGLLASGSDDKTIKLWDLTSHSCLSTLWGHTDTIFALAALPGGTLASGSMDTTIKLWEPRTFSSQRLQPILKALKGNTSVTDLNLSGNRDILDDIMNPLISIFTRNTHSDSKPNTSLKTIDLRGTGVSKKGVRNLVKAIQHQRLSIEVLSDCPIEWMIIYFLIIFCRANRDSPFADSCLDLCKHGELRLFLGISSCFFDPLRKNSSSNSKHLVPTPS